MEISSTTNKDFNKLSKLYLECLLNRNRQKAEEIILQSLESGTDIRDVYLKIFQPVQYEIGKLWQKNEISVAMEHYCTAATQFIMSRLYDYIFSSEKNGLSFVATSVSGELHELGIRMVSDFFEMEGWNTYYLGASTTKEGVLEMVDELNADILAISATIYFNLPHAKDLIKYVKDSTKNSKLKIMVGGKAFSINHNLYKELNADIFAFNAQDAISKANELFNVN